MNQLLLTIAQHLQIPETFILEHVVGDEGVIVILRNHQKFKISHKQLAKAEEKLKEPQPFELGDIVGLGRTSQDRLTEAGIATLVEMVRRNEEEIAVITKHNVVTVKDWFKQARAMLGN